MEKKINKILFYINSIHEGGAERVMVNLTNQFSKDGIEVVLVTSYMDVWEYPLSKEVKRLTLEDSVCSSFLKRNISRISKLRKILKQEKPDAAISFMAEPNIRLLISSFGLKIKTIISVRNDPMQEYKGIVSRIMAKTLFLKADGCVFQTNDAMNWFPKKVQRKSKIIFNAVNDEFYKQKRMPNDLEIVTVGRLESQKNHKLLINAFKNILLDYSNATLKIYGSGSMKDELLTLVCDLKVADSVKLMGATKQVPKALSTADVFVLTSDYEGMPNSLMEAMAMGIPVISTDCPCGGPKMLIKNNETGILVQCGNVKNLEKSIKYLFDNAAEKKELGVRAAKFSLNFKENKIYKVWKNYIMDVINGE